MSAQTTLTEDAPLILDATCSFSHKDRWPAFASIRMDVRKVVKPDIVADARFMPFRDRVIDIEFKDPPHLVRKGSITKIQEWRRRRRNSKDMFTKYGRWESKQQWLDFVKLSNPESARILGPNGTLFYKLTESRDGRILVKHLKEEGSFLITEEKPPTVSKSNIGNRKRALVHWLILKPKPCQKQ